MYRVLIADDEPIERTVVSKTIQNHFHGQLEVIQAVNGREAVEMFFEKECQIALLDIEMPGVNGLESAERIREKDKECSIIFLTAFDEFSYAKRAIGVRAMDYLLKPSAEEELVAVLEEAMRLADEAKQQGREKQTEAALHVDEQRAKERAAETRNEESFEDIRMNAVAEMIRNYIDENYQEDISLQTAASAMNYSDAYFCKIFKQCFDKSFIVYLSEYRVEKAKQLLSDVKNNVKDISQKVGYRDSNYFAKVFKCVAGVTPTEYRVQVLGQIEKQGQSDG